MSSMAAALAAAGAAAGAGATGMAGMGAAPTGTAALPSLPSLLERIGLGFFNQLPNDILQPLLVVFLLASLATAYLAYRAHDRPSALILTALSGALMYLSIYVWMSDVLYLVSVIGLVAAALWGLYLTRRPARVSARATGTA
jgi:asparagine N-glycosylation enzyme membrane subunit Stt3